MTLEPELKQKIERWTGVGFDAETQREVRALLDRAASDAAVADQLRELFLLDLKFGTGGLRAKMGIGTARMNVHTLRKAAQGVASYILRNHAARHRGEIKAALSCDSRINARLFVREVACVFAANGIKTYVFADARPTPMLSFATRHLGCQVGAMVTASHNPKEYNGFKVYGPSGAQVMGKVADDMIESVNATDFADIHTGDYQDLLNQGMIEELGESFDAVYLEVLQKARLAPELAARHGENLRIVFTGIHGTGGSVTPAALASWGFSNVSVVEAQHAPDGNFPTVHSPNPEEGAALELAINQAKAQGADLVMGTDPDADRVGIAIPLPDGSWRLMSGQEVAVMLTYYTIQRRRETNNLPANGAVIKTIVTSDLIARICEANGVEMIETLTGFKYIGAWINSWDDEGHRSPPDKVYIFGGEESYGYLLGVHARDKDAVVACCAIAEMTAWCRERGLSLAGLLDEIHARHGIFQEDGLSLTMEGLAGMRRIERIMANLRQSPPAEMAGRGLSRVRDILHGTVTDGSGRHIEQVSLPSENVLELHYGADLKITARPSGTEPKIKFYLAMADLAGLPIASADLTGRRVRLTSELSALKAALKALIEGME